MMKRTSYSILAALFLAVMLAFTTTACSDDDDNGVVKVDFNESTVAGTWHILRMDSVVSETSEYGGNKLRTFETITYDNVYTVIGGGNYTIWQGSADNVVERGTYNLVESSFRLDLTATNGTTRKVHWLKNDGNTMTLEVPNKRYNDRRARYTLVKQ